MSDFAPRFVRELAPKAHSRRGCNRRSSGPPNQPAKPSPSPARGSHSGGIARHHQAGDRYVNEGMTPNAGSGNPTGLVKDPSRTSRTEWIQEVVYRRFSGKELPKNGKVIARCGNFDNGGIWDKLWSGQDEEDCINPEHLAVIHKRESDTIKKIRYRKAKEMPEQRQTIAGLGRRRDWTEREQGLIFHVASEDLRNDQDPINQARAKAEQGDYDGAVDDLDQAIEANPNDTAA